MKKALIILGVLLGLAGVLCTGFYILVRLKPAMDNAARADAPGSFIRLSNGLVHYQDEGPRSGEVILLIHGSTVPGIIWEKTVGSLNAAGYRTIRADLFGRGYSDRPRISYDYPVFAAQNLELLDSLKIEGKVHIAGISLGAAIAVVAVEMIPQRVASVILMDPAGPFLDNSTSDERWVRLVKGVKALVGGDSEEARLRREKMTPLMELVQKQMKYRGTEYVSVSFMRNRDQALLARAYKTVGALDVPSLLIWGDEDPIIPVKYAQDVKLLIPGIQVHLIAGAGHTPQFELPQVVNPLLVDFLLKVATSEPDSASTQVAGTNGLVSSAEQ